MHLPRKSLITILFSLVVGMTLLGGIASGAEKKKPAKEAKAAAAPAAVAKVNGVSIKRSDLELAMKVTLARNPVNQTPTPEMLQQIETAITQQLIAAELIYQAGQKLEIKDLDKQVDDIIAKNKAKYATPADFEKELKSNNLTDKELQTLARKNIVINNYIDKEIVSKLTANEADAKKFYDENPDKFKTGDSVKASHILIAADEKATADDKKKAKEKAEALLNKIKAGDDFAELAKKESSDPGSAKNGGELGYFGKGQMVPPFEQAAFALKPGEVSGVVESQFGYHIIKVTDVKKAGTVDFNEAKGRIQEYLKDQKAQKAVNDRIEELKAKAKIELVAATAKDAKK